MYIQNFQNYQVGAVHLLYGQPLRLGMLLTMWFRMLYILIYRLIPDGLRLIVEYESLTVLIGEFLMIDFMIGLLQRLILQRRFSG